MKKSNILDKLIYVTSLLQEFYQKMEYEKRNLTTKEYQNFLFLLQYEKDLYKQFTIVDLEKGMHYLEKKQTLPYLLLDGEYKIEARIFVNLSTLLGRSHYYNEGHTKTFSKKRVFSYLFLQNYLQTIYSFISQLTGSKSFSPIFSFLSFTFALEDKNLERQPFFLVPTKDILAFSMLEEEEYKQKIDFCVIELFRTFLGHLERENIFRQMEFISFYLHVLFSLVNDEDLQSFLLFELQEFIQKQQDIMIERVFFKVKEDIYNRFVKKNKGL